MSCGRRRLAMKRCRGAQIRRWYLIAGQPSSPADQSRNFPTSKSPSGFRQQTQPVEDFLSTKIRGFACLEFRAPEEEKQKRIAPRHLRSGSGDGGVSEALILHASESAAPRIDEHDQVVRLPEPARVWIKAGRPLGTAASTNTRALPK